MITTNRRFLLNEKAPGPLVQPGEPNATDAPALLQSNPSSMAFTAFIILVALFFLGFFGILARRFFSGIHVDDDPRRRPAAASPPRRFRGISCAAAARGLDRAVVRQLPVLSYVGGGGKEGCVVCLADFEGKEKVKLIPGCGHVFHPQCIDSWLISKGSCPICRCSDLFGSGVVRGAVRLDLVVGDGGEEFGVDVEVGARRGGVEEVRRRGGGQGEKMVELGRSSSSSGLRVAGEKPVFLRRTCSF
ncbi:RING-H2 finger protein ATL57 [Cocos nucifera]|uniref:RING-type E3 ubiquitin transferase n=1 Tax=Cocos nucifera TaxID=13894 RepID=A0A8K0IL23_COCNU|nr:RING-H2 finger protein ATL57 [Cocos nucifera]